MSSDSRWARELWTPGGGDALLVYAVYGDIDVEAPFDVAKYHATELPEWLDVRRLTREENSDYLATTFEEGYEWDELVVDQPALAAAVKSAPNCLLVRAEVPDPSSLDYLRVTIGFVTFFLDHGGVAVYDPQAMAWRTPDAWRRDIFEPDEPAPNRQTIILYSDDDGPGVGTWFHTRGMRKFGRPDISVRDVPPGQFDAAMELCNRFIVIQAKGEVVAEGRVVRMAGLVREGVVRHGGDLEDPHFNNVHFEVVWRGDA